MKAANAGTSFVSKAAKITKKGWTLEIRVPFSTLRYPKVNPQLWRIMLYRNYPRDFRYQMFSSTLPRGGNCFICRSNHLTGLENLPPAGHLVVAPYGTAKEDATPESSGCAEANSGLVVGFDIRHAVDVIDQCLGGRPLK